MKQFTEGLYYCTTCGVCSTVCKAGIYTVDLWEAVRPNLVARCQRPMRIAVRVPKASG